jgi:glycosyltransferase involved in cell wall biosynthesis
MKEPLNIALVHLQNARNVRSVSGTLYFSKRAFERKIGLVADLTPAPLNLFPYRAAGKLIRKVTGKKFYYDQDASLARRVGGYYSRLLRQGSYDLVFSPCGSVALAYLETDIPIIYYSDMTWRLGESYYQYYQGLLGRNRRDADDLERRAMQRAAILLFPSDWAAESAIRDYGVDPARIHVLNLGANIMEPPTRDQVLPRRIGRTIRLLLVGVNWEIKGGAIALDALRTLLGMGLDAELTVVGCTAPEGVSHPRMRVIPFLNKQVPAEREEFEGLWRNADFFILPTRYEAAGLVFCEAGAYGLPSIATRTGGVPSLVRDGRNGYTLPHEAGGERYAEIIAEIASDPERYASLCLRSRQEYEERLNWDSWGERVAGVIAGRFPHLKERLPKIVENYNMPLSDWGE